MRNLMPQVKKFSRFKAKNYESLLSVQLLDKRTAEYKKLDIEVNNYLYKPTIINSCINGCSNSYANYANYELSPLYGHKEIVKYQNCDKMPLINAIENYDIGKKKWAALPIETRLETIIKVAELIKGKYFYKMLAATMVGQGKNTCEANADSIQEMVDFLYFNVDYTLQILNEQPISTRSDNNYSLYQPLMGFIASYTPFNFTAIAGNLAISPLIWGNCVFWKPSTSSLLSSHLLYNICIEAGIPDTVLQFVVADHQLFTSLITNNKNLGAVLFTGSTYGFNNLIENVNTNYYNKIVSKVKHNEHYNYPRIIGETGGKNFHFVEKSADLDLVVDRTFDSAFGYSGQKCSACSRLYMPMEMWEPFKHKIIQKIKQMDSTMYGVIHKYKEYDLLNYIEELKHDDYVTVISPREPCNKTSYFVPPTLVICHTDDHPILSKELFGPILAVRLYTCLDDAILECKMATPYRLTGAVFSQDTAFLDFSIETFAENCGNFYINDKSTGAIVGQQPFGGFGISGTNDKAGDKNFMRRLCNQRNIKVNKQQISSTNDIRVYDDSGYDDGTSAYERALSR